MLNHAFLLALLPLSSVQSDDFADAWSKVDTAIRRSYYARHSRKDEMEKRLEEYKPIASAAHTRQDFSNIVNKMIGEFRDSHFELFTPEDQGYYTMSGFLTPKDPPKLPQIGAWFKKTDRGYTIQMVLEGGAAEKAGLHQGDLMLKVGDVDFSPVTALREVGSPATLTYRRGTETRTASVAIEDKTSLGMFLDATRKSAKVIEKNNKKIGYVHLWTMANDDFRKALESAVYGPLRDTDALILDLRDGFGGRPEGFVDPFFRPELMIEWKVAGGQAMKQLYGYGRPMAVLINAGTRSAKEVVSYAFKKSKRAILVGTNTAGHVLGTSPQRANDWAILEIPMVEVIADGERMEGVGVAPDIQVEDGFDADGNDRVIQTALDSLSGTSSLDPRAFHADRPTLSVRG